MLELRIGGIDCRVSLLFPAVLLVLLAFDRSGLAAFGFLAALLHESGHLLTLFLFGCKPDCLRFSFFGMSIRLPAAAGLSTGQRICVALSGPFVNAFCAWLLWVCGVPIVYVAMHLALLIMNLLPVIPLDGGQVLSAILQARMEADEAEKWTTRVSLAVFVPLFTAGTLLLLASGYNFTLLAVSLYVGLLIIFRKGN